METYKDPAYFLGCPRCGTPEGERCRAVGGNRAGMIGQPVMRMHPERPRVPGAPPLVTGRRRDHELVERRLTVWKRRALMGDPVDDIATELRMSRAALDQYVARARRRGHPKAVYHASVSRV